MIQIRDSCIGYAIKGWLTLIWLLILLFGSRAPGQESPKTDHIKNAGCFLGHNQDFTVYTVKYHIAYTDGTPDYNALIEKTPDLKTAADECKTFMYATLIANVDAQIAEKTAALEKAKDEHFFLRVQATKKAP